MSEGYMQSRETELLETMAKAKATIAAMDRALEEGGARMLDGHVERFTKEEVREIQTERNEAMDRYNAAKREYDALQNRKGPAFKEHGSEM